VKKLTISGILFALASLNLPYRLSEESFFRLENILEPVSSFSARGNATEGIPNNQRLRKTRKGTDICESESSCGG
jgi:hypothetical protein